MKIGIAGVGGIGSNVARHLAQAKVKEIKIVDFDRVEASNLNRQFYEISQVGKIKTDCLKRNLLQIFPDMKIEVVDMKLQAGDSMPVFSDCAIVVEGFDDKFLKKMMVEELSSTGKTIVSASGIAGSEMKQVVVKKIGCCHVVGDLVSDQDKHLLFPPKIAMVASMMAGIVLNTLKDENNE